jgi:DNA-binding NtrC family response regulator
MIAVRTQNLEWQEAAYMRILVLDDEPEILAILSKWLSGRGHRPHATADATKALELIGAGAFDAVFLDLMMPQTNGLTFISKIHDLQPRLPVIVISGIDDLRVGVLAAKEKIDAYLTKPIDFEKLTEILNRLSSEGR